MKALVLKENYDLKVEELEKPIIKDDSDVIVKVTAAAICGSDLHFWKGEIPSIRDFVLGHEFVGVIDSIGKAVKRFNVGDRVAVPALPYCGICAGCKSGEYYKCQNSVMFGWRTKAGYLPGGQAEYVRVPYADTGLVSIPASVSDKEALLVGDILSTAYFGVTNGNLKPGDDIAIFGAGPVGLCAVACAKLFSPARIILVDLEDYRLEKGIQLGATDTFNPKRDSVIKEIRSLTSRLGVDVSLDAVGLPATLDDCINVTKQGGIVSIVGVGPTTFNVNMGKMFLRNHTLKTGLVPLNNMDRLMKLVEHKMLDVTSIITHELGMDQIIAGYNMFANKEDQCIKVMIKP